jgi:hypothetical protein
MKHLAVIQLEFLKESRDWDNLTLEEQKNYLKRHPASKRRLTAKNLDNTQLTANSFKTKDGFVNFKKITKDNRYEFEDENDSFWDKTNDWIEIDVLRVNEKFKGKGSILLKQFINKLPEGGTGIVLNANPLDDDISFEKLQDWYKKQGFQEIAKHNHSLYLIK